MKKSRREFLKTIGKMAGGVALVTAAAPMTTVLGQDEKETEAQEDYNWEPNALPCELIEEITDESTPEGFRAFKYTPDNRVHITEILFEMNVADRTVHNIKFQEGCDGSTEAVANMADGKEANFIISRLKGLECNLIKSGSSCPDALACAVEQADNIISNVSCTHCFFTGDISKSACNKANQFTRA